MTTLPRDRGATLPIVALVLPVLILMTAFAVDLGRQRSSRRTMQARADVIALDLVRLADGRPEVEVLMGDASHPSAETALVESAARNEVDRAKVVSVDWGTMVNGLFDTNAVPFPDAVKVTLRETTDYFFRPGGGDAERSAVATAEPLIDLTVGSVAAGFQPDVPDSVALDAEVNALNARLAAHFGASVPNPGTAGFDLVGYRGLAAADVDFRRVAANAGFASPNELFDSDITVGDFFDATATALDQQAAEGDPNAATAAAEMRRFQTQMGVDNSATMRLGDTLSYEQGGDDAAATGDINVLDLLSGSADVINGTDFVAYQLTPTVPGIASVNVSQQSIRKADWQPGLGVGGTAQNKQVRFQIDLVVAPLTGMTQPLTIPFVVEAATAIGTVDHLTCATPTIDSEAGIDVSTTAVTVTLGTAADLSVTTPGGLVINAGVLIEGGGLTVAALLNLGLSLSTILGLDLAADTTGTATASLGGGTDFLTFFPNDEPVAYQRAPGGLGAVSIGTQLKSSFVASLGSTLLGTTASTAMANQLDYVFSNLQTTILDPLLEASGVAIGGADVLADELQCSGPKLVG
ncbi:MAG: pilus assembly protein TadG-related protein [Actinomycetota bacterium]